MYKNTNLSPAEVIEALEQLIKYDLVYEHDDMTKDGRLYAIPAMPNIEGLNSRNSSEG
jgi:hypothetical protein